MFWQDPAGVVAAIGRDALRLFALTRLTSPGDTPIARWQFQTAYPTYQHVSLQTVRAAGQRFGGGGPAVSRPLAAFLRAYQLHGGYTPGPLLALAALAGLAGSTGVLRRRRIRGPDPGDRGADPGTTPAPIPETAAPIPEMTPAPIPETAAPIPQTTAVMIAEIRPLLPGGTPSATCPPPACCASPSPSRCCSPLTRSNSAGATSSPRWSRCRPPAR